MTEQRPENIEDVPLGLELRRLRRVRGLSQRQTAEALHLGSHGTISDYESGRRTPPADILASYESLFGLPKGRLLRSREVVLVTRAMDDYQAALDARRDKAESLVVTSAEPAAVVTLDVPSGLPPGTASRAVGSAPAPAASPISRARIRPWMILAFSGALAGLATAFLPPFLPRQAVRSSPSAYPSPLASGWRESTQHVSDHQEASGPIPDMDGDDPRARGCIDDAITLASSPFRLPDGNPGTLRLRYSDRCHTEWASAYYANPKLFTVRLTAARPQDGALVWSQWSNNTPPGSYGDMLSAGPGCVLVEVSVASSSPGTPAVRTPCVRGNTRPAR